MANYEVPQEPEFNSEIRKLETSDPANASLFNVINLKLFINEIFLKLLIESHLNNQANIHNVTKEQVGLENVDNTADMDKPIARLVQEALDQIYASGNGYTDQKIADLINGAPTTLDTLKELADAIASNKSVADALNAAIGKKANQAELDTHTNNGTVHITASERTKWNTVDAALSATSTNPIQSKAVQAAITSQNSNFTNSIAAINNNLGGNILSKEGSGANTKYYIQSGADAASKKLLGNSLFKIAVTNNDLKVLLADTNIDYKKLTIDDFYIKNAKSSLSVYVGNETKYNGWRSTEGTLCISSYNNVTGILSTNGSGVQITTPSFEGNQMNASVTVLSFWLICDGLKCSK